MEIESGDEVKNNYIGLKPKTIEIFLWGQLILDILIILLIYSH